MATYREYYNQDGTKVRYKVTAREVVFRGPAQDLGQGDINIQSVGRVVDDNNEPILVGGKPQYVELEPMVTGKIQDALPIVYETSEGTISAVAVLEWISQYYDNHLEG